jgi:ribosomal subunit interface protein
MQISVTGKQIDVGDFLRGHVETTATGVVEKYFDRAIEAHVVFYRERHLIHADVSVHAGRGLVVQCRAEANDAYAAFDIAAERLDKQLRRYKRRLRRHHGRAKDGAGETPQPATAYVLAAYTELDEDATESASDDKPLVIAEMKTNIPQLSVSEAVMRLDLAALPALLFRNSAHGSLNMIYRRPDGNIGWIDPDLVANRSGGAQEGFLTDGNR